MTIVKGLEGVVALSSKISSIVDGILTYRGYNIDDLANHSTFEEVAYLLWYGHLPTKSELNVLTRSFEEHASIPEDLMKQLEMYPHHAHPMSVLRTAIFALAMYDKNVEKQTEDANREKAIRLTAKIPTIITAFARLRKGLKPLQPKEHLNISGNFLYMLNGEEPTMMSAKALDKALVLHADHELNASTFAARVSAGTLTDMYSAVTAAIGALKGPLHGGANEQVMGSLQQMDSINHVQTVIQERLNNKEKIMGFGHRVYKDGDPRAKHLREMSRQLGEQSKDTKWYDMSIEIERIVSQQKGLKPNVDFYSASVYTYLGIPKDLFTPIFAMSRITGWTAHILEQFADNRLIRPRAEYVGMTNMAYQMIDRRS